ncbi:MAG: epoxyqueuosine reductase QueH [Lachnospiraceae bacterium]|nr:epoxyqueuosine reductase QueH [Lachnospiraceae bacterium]
MGTDFFGTTLTLSPLKNSNVINALGEIVADKAARSAEAEKLKMTGTDGMTVSEKKEEYPSFVTLAELSEKLKANDWGRADIKDPGKYVPGAAAYLDTDFKKNGGYQRSIELSREYGLYRQNYCGCLFSRMQREKETENRNSERGYASGKTSKVF